MGELILRKQFQADNKAYVVPKALHKKATGLTKSEALWVYHAPIIALISLLVFLAAILVDPTQTISGEEVPAAEHFWQTPALLLGLINMMIFGPTAVMQLVAAPKSSILNYSRRRQLVMDDRQRRLATHSDDRVTRYKDVRYNQYSVIAERAGDNGLKFVVVEHSPGFTWKLSPYYKTHRRTKKQLDGTFDHDTERPIHNMIISNPTLEDAQKAMERVEELAASLEEKSYAEQLKSRKMDRIAILINKPPATVEQEVAHEVEFDDVDYLGRAIESGIKNNKEKVQ